jgi:penicillin-binding protein 2
MCHGHTTLYGNTFDCWDADGHGAITVHDALVHSCNVFFYLVGDRLGIDRISEYAVRMGLGRPTGIDLPNEDAGLIPSAEWKRRAQSAPWYPGDTISVSIGQGAVGVTPLQLTWAVGGVAAGGSLVQPHIVDPGQIRRAGVSVPDLEEQPYPLRADTVGEIREALWGVVNAGGTGTLARVQGFDVAGKTGTAQVVASGNAGNVARFQPHGWFVGFAPYDAPEIAVGVFVENGGGGGEAAAPVAQQIFRAYFEKHNAFSTGTAVAPAPGLLN